MAHDIEERLHILTLVIKRGQDVPLVRNKTKLLARGMGLSRLSIIQMATTASETARFFLDEFGGARVTMSLVKSQSLHDRCALELFFEESVLPLEHPPVPQDCKDKDLSSMPALATINKILDRIVVSGGKACKPLTLQCLKWGPMAAWEDLQDKQTTLRNELFFDTEESYLENLRAKHDEVQRLLFEKSEKNTELNRANTELLELSQDLEALAQERTIAEMSLAIADQVRNPAIAIGGLIKNILRKESVPGVDANKLEAILHQAEKLEEIVGQFDQLAKNQSKLFTVEDLRHIVEESVSAWNDLKEGPDIAIALQVPPDPISVRANRRTLKLALVHLLRNAVEASSIGDTITVHVTRQQGKPTVIIADQGKGISPEDQEKLFKEPFTTRTEGDGLGLLLVQQIIHEHQGVINIESKAYRGTVVFITFPIRWQERYMLQD